MIRARAVSAVIRVVAMAIRAVARTIRTMSAGHFLKSILKGLGGLVI